MKTLLAAIITLIMMSQACTKKEVCMAGSGGNLTIVASPQHHTKPLPSKSSYPDTVYVKFNAHDYPGSIQAFDAVFTGKAGEDHVNLTGLKCGDYYFFGTAFDTTLHVRVKGGMPYSTAQSSGTINLNLAVSE